MDRIEPVRGLVAQALVLDQGNHDVVALRGVNLDIAPPSGIPVSLRGTGPA